MKYTLEYKRKEKGEWMLYAYLESYADAIRAAEQFPHQYETRVRKQIEIVNERPPR